MDAAATAQDEADKALADGSADATALQAEADRLTALAEDAISAASNKRTPLSPEAQAAFEALLQGKTASSALSEPKPDPSVPTSEPSEPMPEPSLPAPQPSE
jgi:hypothetical protein